MKCCSQDIEYILNLILLSYHSFAKILVFIWILEFDIRVKVTRVKLQNSWMFLSITDDCKWWCFLGPVFFWKNQGPYWLSRSNDKVLMIESKIWISGHQCDTRIKPCSFLVFIMLLHIKDRDAALHEDLSSFLFVNSNMKGQGYRW